MPKSRWRSLLVFGFSMGVVVLFAYYLYENAGQYLGLSRFSWLPVTLILFLTIVGLLINGAINRCLFQGLGTKFSFWDSFFLSAASTLANQLPVSGGVVTRGFYLRQKYNLPYAQFFSATLALFFCFVAANGMIGLGILLYWILFRGVVVHVFLLGGFSLMAASCLVFLPSAAKVGMPLWMRKWFEDASTGWQQISRKPLLVGEIIGWQTALMLVLAFRYWLAFHMLSQNVSAGEVILFSSAAVLTQLVSFAPGGLGVTEAIVGAVASLLGFDLGVSVAAVALDRLISTLVILSVGGFAAIILGRQIAELRASSRGKDI